MTKRNGNGTQEIRYAVVGLGHIAQVAVLPGFTKVRGTKLAALVSDDAEKLAKLAAKYEVPHTCSYAEYDALLATGAIDAVYIALPNHLHRDFTIRAAQKGVHVLCEKPLGLSVDECREMIDACKAAKVRLMTAYRLHFEKATLEAIELVNGGHLGEPRYFSSVFGFQVKEDNIRTDRERGGGALYDIGIYCINAARNLFGCEPVRVSAFAARAPNDPRFANIAETFACTLEMPGERLAQFTVGFGSAAVSSYRLVGTKGDLVVEPAYEYSEGLTHTVTMDGKDARSKRFPKRDQFAAEIEYFSQCLREGIEPEPSGEEGMLDLRVIEALHRSAREGRSIELEPYERTRRPTHGQTISKRPNARAPQVFHADAPHY